MFTKQDIQLIRDQLATFCSNYIALVSRKTGLSRATVSKFFNDGKIRPENQAKIYESAIELIRIKNDQHKNRIETGVELAKWKKDTTINAHILN
jgi:hypothetical protein